MGWRPGVMDGVALSANVRHHSVCSGPKNAVQSPSRTHYQKSVFHLQNDYIKSAT